jgi:hypothetical protein
MVMTNSIKQQVLAAGWFPNRNEQQMAEESWRARITLLQEKGVVIKKNAQMTQKNSCALLLG